MVTGTFILSQTNPGTYVSSDQVSENTVGKGEIARNEQFLLFPQCFLLNQIIVSSVVHIFDVISFFAAALEECKIGISYKGFSGHTSDFLAAKEAVRIVGGPNNYTGRVEVLHNGEWGRICGEDFGRPDAVVICRILGFKNP